MTVKLFGSFTKTATKTRLVGKAIGLIQLHLSIYLSTKYDTPHVVCFSNFHPDKSKLSWDRWDIRSFGKAFAEADELIIVLVD